MSSVREEPDEVESLTSGFEAESGERFPGLGNCRLKDKLAAFKA